MKYKLMVSYDAGGSYSFKETSNDIEKLKKMGEELDKEWLRWVIEDEQGEIMEFSLIHKQIVDTMEKINQG